MEISELTELLTKTPNDQVQTILSEAPPQFNIKKFDQYDPYKHAVHSKAKRRDKEVLKPTGAKNADNTDGMTKDIVKVNRLSIPLQKLIVRRTAAFLVGGKVKLEANIKPEETVQQKLYDAVSKTWKDNKLQYKNKRLAKMMMAETECAELWFTDEKIINGKNVIKLKMNILAPSLGNTLHPVFDFTGDLIAFGYGYKADNKRFFILYTGEKRYDYSETGQGGWALDDTVDLKYGKIPIVYYSQPNPQWWDVQPLIERLETIHSNHGDTNDYNGSPILKLKGKVQGIAAKGEAGKAFQMDADADISYVTWDNAPESVKMEVEQLRSWIFGGCQVADLSPEFLKGLGDISGAALDRILIDMHLMAKDMQDDVYGECIQRRVNFLITAHIALDGSLSEAAELDITPEYSLFRINDESERIQNALLANGNKPVISHKSSIAYANLVNDADTEYDAIKEEEDALGKIIEEDQTA